MKRLLHIFLFIFVFFCSRVDAYEPIVSRHVLDNGLTVVIQEMPNNPMVSVYMLVKAGSATEGKYLGCGLSHFLEHMLFKGTERRKPGEIAAEIQAVGGNLNASTSMDYTIYTINVPYEEFNVGLDVLTDMIMNSTLNHQEVQKEREVVFNEMRMVYDRPEQYLSRLAYGTVYTKHPYKHPIIGYKDLLAQVSRDEMMEYYKSRYFPNNMVLSVAGNVKTEEVLPLITEMFKSYSRKPYLAEVVPAEPDQISSRRVEDFFETDLTQVSIGFPSVNLLDHDLYALDVLAQILGDGESSRLYKTLVKDQKIVENVSSSNYTPMDKGVFEVEAVLADESKVDAVVDEVIRQIGQIKIKGVTAEELKKAAQQVLSEYIFSNLTTNQVAWSLAYNEAFAGDFQFSRKYVEGIEKVTVADIKRVANQYLVGNSQNTIILRPKSSELTQKEKQKEFKVAGIQKEVLPNGLTILTHENPQFDTVSIRLNMRGGVYEEPKDLNGTARLTADVWTMSTKSRTSREMAEFVESKGIYLSGSSGRNSTGINLDCLNKDLDICLDLLKEIVLTPAFPQEEIDLTKQQDFVSLKYRDKDIFQLSSFQLQQNLFDQHPLRLDVQGTEETLKKITRDDLVKFYQKITVPNNMVLSVFGNIDAKKVIERIKKDYGNLARQDIEIHSFTEDPITSPRQVNLTLDKEQAIIQYGFRAVDFKHPDYYKLDVLISILGSSFNGRMFLNIRDIQGKAYTLGADVAAGIDAGFIYFYVLTDDKSVEDVDRLVLEEIKKIQNESVSDKELSDIKRFMKGSHKSSLQTEAALNSTSNLYELYNLGYDYHTHYDEFVDAVSSSDVMEMAKKYLDTNKMVTVYIRPKSVEKIVDVKPLEPLKTEK
ncbi:MAG: insulinase family protein [Candidatus Omnitrophica bacterium]|nr:insulinase family protein [Candidatus Omnitrophota bacterium]